MYDQYIECLPDDYVIIEHVPSDFDLRRDTIPANQAVIEVLNSMPFPVPFVLDFTNLCLGVGTSNVLAQVTRGAAPAYSHRNIKVLCVVVGASTLKLGALALAQADYHGIDTRVFDTLDQAVSFARNVKLPGKPISSVLAEAIPHAAAEAIPAPDVRG